MKKRHQLLEEAGRLRRLSQARRGDLAWAALTGRVSAVELDRRAAEARALVLQAEDLERQADATSESYSLAFGEPAEERRRRRDVLLHRASAIRDREATCRRLCARERALGAVHRAEFLAGVAAQLEAKWRHLEAQAANLPPVPREGPADVPALTPAFGSSQS